MKALEIVAAGGPNQLILRDRPSPEPADGQVLAQVGAVGIGFVDVMMREGHYPGVEAAGLVPGAEIAGRVIAVGRNVGHDLIGSRIYAICGTGGCAEQICLDAASLIPLPDSVSFDAAVGTGINALVAYFALDRTNVSRGEEVLIRGASGGIGSMAIQLANLRGAVTTAATGRADKASVIGAGKIADRTGGNGTFDVIIDPVAGPALGDFLNKLNPNGRLIVCGAVAGLPPADFAHSLVSGFFRSPTLSLFSLNSISPPETKAAAGMVFAMVADGRLKPQIARTIALTEVAQAHRDIEAGAIMGKVVVVF